MIPLFSRRRFLTASAASTLAASSGLAGESNVSQGATFSMDRTSTRFYVPGLETPSRFLHVTDTHLFLDDERGKPFQEFSTRMAGAYHQNQHVKTGQPVTPMEAFEEALRLAREKQVDGVALTGDILSFPSEAGADWALERLKALEKDQIPFHYTAGNHDWHYEGCEGTDAEQRAEWLPKRLSRFYAQDVNPLCFSVVKKGIRHLFIDDSIYEILPEQTEFLHSELALGEPSVVWMHVPPYAPGRSVGFGCGHPNWGANTDTVWKIERRRQWPKNGHSKASFDFYHLLCGAPNLLGTFCGHIHSDSLDLVCGKPFVVTEANARGGVRLIEFLPFPKEY